MNDPQTPEEQTPEFLQARVAMNADANQLVEILLKQLSIYADYYEPALNLHFVHPNKFLLDFVIEKLQERS